MQTLTTLAPGTVVLDRDGDALRIVNADGAGYTVDYEGGRVWVNVDTIDEDARVRFTVTKHTDAASIAQGAPWFVTSDTPDPDGDTTWGHFRTHADALAFTAAVNAR